MILGHRSEHPKNFELPLEEDQAGLQARPARHTVASDMDANAYKDLGRSKASASWRLRAVNLSDRNLYPQLDAFKAKRAAVKAAAGSSEVRLLLKTSLLSARPI